MSASDERLIFKSWSNFNQEIFLWSFDFKTEKTHEIYTYFDTFGIKDIKAEQRIVTSENYSNHFRMGDIDVPELERLKDQQERHIFLNSILIQEQYAPFFSDSSHHYFFNFLNDSVYVFDNNHMLTSKKKWSFKKSTKVESLILFDSERSQFYWLDSFNSTFIKFKPPNCNELKRTVSKAAKATVKCIRNGKVYFLDKKSQEDSFNKIFVQRL